MTARSTMRLNDPESGAGTRRRFEELYAEYAPAVFAFARRRASAADAEDVVADTFLVAWRRLADLPEHTLPWLLRVARNNLANRERGERRRTALTARLAAVGDIGRSGQAGSEVADSRALEAVLRALGALPIGERDALTLLAWENLTPQEAAAVLGCSRAAFYLRLHRARRRFAQRLEGAPSLFQVQEPR